MKNLFAVLLLALLLNPNAFAFKDGKLTCQFEVISTKTFPKAEMLPPFSFSIKEQFTEAYQAKNLSNRLIIAYYPAFEKPGQITKFIMNMKYDGANSSAEAPAVNKAEYVFAVSRDESDLVGAFLHCTSDLQE